MNAPLLDLHGARLRLGGRDFGPFDVAARPGERIAILGPSGAGKSTLLRLAAGDLAARDGGVRLAGRPVRDWTPAALSRRRAVLPQAGTVAFGLEVELVVGLGRVARGTAPVTADIVRQALALASAGHLAGRRFDRLSGGEQARVHLARVFAQLWDEESALLLADEPLAALDPGLQLELLAALDGFTRQRGHALVAVLHDINQALAGFDRLWLVSAGRLLADTPATSDALPLLEALYGIGLDRVDRADGRCAVLPRRLSG
ncbi:ATP-binding cassette domain-containing protein [Derxia lacustris]|uniref:ATP-binding cassette domain-containing protein n=1 Tax=Derxia lacustris TaxID=764842 RepID=UPI000A174C88|nr:ATP-binding cassette domain-containing protein [Derxia lacustris]